MINKSKRKFLFAFMAFFVSMTTTFAKEMTLDQLRDMILKVNPNTEDAYVIGNYVFTNSRSLTTQDVMLASTTLPGVMKEIDPTDPAQMTINHVEYDLDEDGNLRKDENGNVIFKVGPNFIGEGTLENVVDIKWIDYKAIDDDALVPVDSLVKEATGKINKKLFEATYANKKITAKIVGLDESFAQGMGSKILLALQELLGDGSDIESIEFSYEGVPSFTYNKDDILVWLETNSEKIFGNGKNYTDVTGEALIGKSFKATVNLVDSKLSTDYNKSETYTIEFVADTENTDDLVKAALDTQQLFKDGEIDINKNNITVSMKNPNTTLYEGMGVKVLEAFQNIVTNDNVKSVGFTIVRKDGKTYPYNSSKDGNILTWLENNCKNVLGKEVTNVTNADLAGISVTAKINLKDSVKNTGIYEEYTFSFVNVLTEDDFAAMGKSAINTINGSNKYNVEVNGDVITVGVQDLNTVLSSTNELKGTGIQTALANYLKNESIANIQFNFTIGDDEYSSIEITDAQTAEDGMMKLMIEVVAKTGKTSITYADLNELNIKVTVNLAENTTFENRKPFVEYTIQLAE